MIETFCCRDVCYKVRVPDNDKKGERVAMNLQDYTKAVDNYSDSVYRMAYSYTYIKADAEDVLQNVFLKLFQSGKDFNSGEHLKQWLLRVTVNECHNLHRSFWKRNIIHMEEIEKSAQNFRTDDVIDLHNALQQLPSEYRVIIHMYYYEGYKTKEISKILKVKEATVRTRLARGRDKLRNLLEEE